MRINLWFTRKNPISFESAGLSDIGLVRTNNEDSFFLMDKNESGEAGVGSYGIYLIADGMGGHQAGEIASAMAKDIISIALQEKLDTEAELSSPDDLIKLSIEKANNEIFNASTSKPELHSMGTTVTLGLRIKSELYLGHVGDSRAYLFRKGKLEQLTEDHSLIAQLIKEGVITLEEAKTHPDRGKILRCLGVSGDVKVDGFNKDSYKGKLTLKNGDSLLFCSDGLNGYASDREIMSYLKKNEEAETICRNLVNLANLRGGGDNISVVVVKVKSGINKPVNNS